MIIGIDGNEANCENRVGVNNYAYQILRALHKLQGEQKSKHKFIVYLSSPPREDMPPENFHWKYEVLPGRGLWILTRLTPHIYKSAERPNILFTPSHYVPPVLPIARVCSIMDLGYLNFSDQFKFYDYWQLRLWSAVSLKVVKRVVAISNTTRKDIVRRYPFARDKVKVTLLGYEGERFNMKISSSDVRRIMRKYSIVSDYVLYLGTLKPSKNIEGLIEAFEDVSQKNPELQLVIAGKKGWLFDSIFDRVEKMGLSDKVIFTDFVPREDVAPLIFGAKLFCLVSFWEGFGIDVLSAMACGTPVLLSKKGSLPEVGGSAAIYIDAKNPQDISEKMKEVISMRKSEYNKLVEKGLQHVKKFSWEEAGRKTLKILEGAAIE